LKPNQSIEGPIIAVGFDEWLLEGRLGHPEVWLSLSGTLAHFDTEYYILYMAIIEVSEIENATFGGILLGERWVAFWYPLK